MSDHVPGGEHRDLRGVRRPDHPSHPATTSPFAQVKWGGRRGGRLGGNTPSHPSPTPMITPMETLCGS